MPSSPKSRTKLRGTPPRKSARSHLSSAAQNDTAAIQNGVAIALAGGGFLGAAYELGVLAALHEAIGALDLNNLTQYVGVSAGAYLAAGLANGFTPHQMVRMFVEAEDSQNPIAPETLLKPAYASLWAAFKKAPSILSSTLGQQLFSSGSGWRILEQIGNAMPAGFIDSKPAATKMAELFSLPGKSNDFRDFGGRLRILATDINSGQSIEFGTPDYSDVPISTAIAASSAVPGIFAPVVIKGRRYLDGALNKTLHASVALQGGAKLVICINPLVPYGAIGAVDSASERTWSLPEVLSQSIRTVIRSRMTVGLEKYAVAYPLASVLLFEPNSDDAAIFKTSIFSLKDRRKVCELAYQQTRKELVSRRAEIEPKLKLVGLYLRDNVINGDAPALVGINPKQRPRRPKTLDAAALRLRHVLDDIERKVAINHLG